MPKEIKWEITTRHHDDVCALVDGIHLMCVSRGDIEVHVYNNDEGKSKIEMERETITLKGSEAKDTKEDITIKDSIQGDTFLTAVEKVSIKSNVTIERKEKKKTTTKDTKTIGMATTCNNLVSLSYVKCY